MPKGAVAVIAPDARGELPSVSVRAVADMELDGVPRKKGEVFDLERNIARNLVAAKMVKRVTAADAEAPPAGKKSTRSRKKG